MRVLGIDPGLATTGWAIIDFVNDKIDVVDFGVISTLKGQEVSVRLVEIYKDIHEILDKFTPEIAGVETLLFTNNIKTAMSVGEARGVVMLSLQQYNLNIYQFSPTQVKSSITGSGRADKRQVQENVKRICNMDELPTPDDAADAIAVAIACYDVSRVNKLIGVKND